MYIRVHLLTANFGFAKHRYCVEPPPSMAVLILGYIIRRQETRRHFKDRSRRKDGSTSFENRWSRC